MIYVISQGESAIVKIGHGGNPKKRVTELQTGSPIPLVLQWTHEGDENLEGHLHAVFKEYRIRGEWFDLTPLGDAVSAVQEAVGAAFGTEMLKPARFRGPKIFHPAVPAAKKPAARQVSVAVPVAVPPVSTRDWDSRFPPLRQSVVRCGAGQDARPGCIRGWQGRCHRPAETTCGC